jgi:hypothetical protein
VIEQRTCQIEEATTIAGQPAITPPLPAHLRNRSGAQGHHGSNAEIVAIDPPSPAIFRAARHLQSTCADL